MPKILLELFHIIGGVLFDPRVVELVVIRKGSKNAFVFQKKVPFGNPQLLSPFNYRTEIFLEWTSIVTQQLHRI